LRKREHPQQAGIHNDGGDDFNVQTLKHPSDEYGEQQCHDEADEPTREIRAQNVDRRGSLTAADREAYACES